MKELIYLSTYHAMKAGPCRVGVCKHDGECGKCKEYGELRRYAARDTDRIHELRALVKEMADEKRISDAVIQSLRDKKLEMAGEIATKEAEIAKLNRKVYEYEKLLASSPIGLIYQLGICNRDGDVMNGIGILFTNEAERAKMPRVGHGDKFYVVPYKESEVAK